MFDKRHNSDNPAAASPTQNQRGAPARRNRNNAYTPTSISQADIASPLAETAMFAIAGKVNASVPANRRSGPRTPSVVAIATTIADAITEATIPTPNTSDML